MSEDCLYNESQLLIKVSEGNELAFRQLFDAYSGKLYSCILKITESKETAEDTVHEVFLKLWQNRSQLREIQHLNAYIFKMARNHAYNGIKRMAKEVLVMAELAGNINYDAVDPIDKLVRKEVRQMIHEAVNKLTPQQKEVFKLSRELGLKQEDIAQQMNISIFTVKKHLTDALNYLRKEISTSYGLQALPLCIIYSMHFC